MNKFIGFFAAVLLTISSTSFAQQTQWVHLFTSNNIVWDVKKDSLDVNQTNGGDPVFTLDVRARESNQITFYTVYVTLEHCAAERGKLVFIDMSGEVSFKSDFMFGGETNGSFIAKGICEVGMNAIREYQKQSSAKKIST